MKSKSGKIKTKKELKKVSYQLLSAVAQESNSHYVLVTHNGLSCSKVEGMRRSVFEMNGRVIFFKKKVACLAFKKTPLNSALDQFKGQLFMLVSTENMQGISAISARYQEEFDGLVSIYLGMSEGRLWSKEEVQELASLGSLPEMQARMLGAIIAPVSALLSLLSEYIKVKSGQSLEG